VVNDTIQPREAHAWYERVLESELEDCHVRISMDTCCANSSRRHNKEKASGHFHLVSGQGRMLTGSTLCESTNVRSGDLAIFIGDVRHVFVAARQTAPAQQTTSAIATLYGDFYFDMGNASYLPWALPELIIVRSAEASLRLRTLTTLLMGAAQEAYLGHQLVTDKIASSVLALAVCEYITGAGTLPPILSPQDARIARVLLAVHDQLSQNWSVHSLAAIAGMSRSTFVLRFSTVVGIPPMRYITSLKVARASQLLGDQSLGLSVAEVAERLGYSSESAFRKMFKRVAGIGPGKIRNGTRSRLYTSNFPCAIVTV
jgi:AraC family transcriptional regulator, activator of mtrCDE